MFSGAERVYNEDRIEPFQTLADTSKANLDLDWRPKGNLVKWVKQYLENLTHE